MHIVRRSTGCSNNHGSIVCNRQGAIVREKISQKYGIKFFHTMIHF